MRTEILDNGLRVLLDPRPNSPVTGIAVHYDVGFRSEPEGRTGFAHLFEHLMFQGSENVARGEHFRHVQASGGTANAATHHDHTDYHQLVPPGALERVLFLEADRMRALRISAENLRTQVAVVQEEIRLQVTNRPYGGFPWTVLPGVLYDTFPNAHNGYGDLRELERATVAECEAFFAAHYTPANAVLTISGPVDPHHALTLVHRHFGDIPAHPAAPRPRLTEPPPRGERRGEHRDPHAPLPAVALGYRMPDPAADLGDYLAHMVLARLLAGGDDARLRRRLVHDGTVTSVRASCGFFGPLQARDPDTFLLVAHHPPTTDPEAVPSAVDEELDRLAATGPDPRELAHATARAATALCRSYDDPLTRTRHAGAFALLHDTPHLVTDLPTLLPQVTAESVTHAAKALRTAGRAVLTLIPGGGP
ncbi:M16 family metallopeptidase [Streptomyces cyaneus]|uniref:M16 family metallopeptidase n=1 Tax=Streptomyces cyaneus TaxID=1904 RepID=UPI000FF87A02|nr:pitrilysin family protein [Streptomyces cyaneus]